jgi:general stress protein 26
LAWDLQNKLEINQSEFRTSDSKFQAEEHPMAPAPRDKFDELIEDFDTAMLVSRGADGELRSRPMAIAEVEPGAVLWFFTQRDSGKMDELARDNHVNVAMQSKLKFVSLSGRARVIDDRARVERLWNESWKAWFPGGKDDPALVLLEVWGDKGEYWDNSGLSGVKYLIEAGKAYLSGERPDVARDPQIHGKVAL